MKNIKMDAEITHNILRSRCDGDISETIQKCLTDNNFDSLEAWYASPRNKNYLSSLKGMKLVFETILNDNKDNFKLDVDAIEELNKEYGKLTRNLIRIINFPLPTNSGDIAE